MASRTGPEVLVESDFLFGLRDSDVHHPYVMRALTMHSTAAISIGVLSSAVMEVRSVLCSRGRSHEVIEDALSLMDAMLAQRGVRKFVPLELSDAILAERMRTEEKRLGFFDSLHAAVSYRLGIRLLSSEGAYRSLGLEVMDLDKP